MIMECSREEVVNFSSNIQNITNTKEKEKKTPEIDANSQKSIEYFKFASCSFKTARTLITQGYTSFLSEHA